MTHARRDLHLAESRPNMPPRAGKGPTSADQAWVAQQVSEILPLRNLGTKMDRMAGVGHTLIMNLRRLDIVAKVQKQEKLVFMSTYPPLNHLAVRTNFQP